MCTGAESSALISGGMGLGGNIIGANTQAQAEKDRAEREERMKRLEMALMYGSGGGYQAGLPKNQY